MAQIHLSQCQGLRSLPSSLRSNNLRQFQQQRVSRPRANGHLQIFANKKVKKLQQVVVTPYGSKNGLGEAGEITKVTTGYFRNYLHPKKLALPATDGVFANILKKEQDDERAAEKVEAKAQAMATALRTINKFIIKRKSGDQNTIFGSVTAADVVKAIESQTGKLLDKKVLEVPNIKKLGTYEIAANLHPNVTGRFKLMVQREKEQQKK